ncbi:hypothetical protein SISSUDRAFT_700101 [Sistotremastrum suecicum HHB10207 ss-3]|uniref:Uncharacterized protein n=1 Tax=Sistotremastrum suecicum HHB10207 ss-3 TaxID=1314776 RepID=A0A166DV15_9AGAM|nr:hypothetical protein SISSUDRAFT_700101 [Sistotremastrum suecicum HHB10207 ss-3]
MKPTPLSTPMHQSETPDGPSRHFTPAQTPLHVPSEIEIEQPPPPPLHEADESPVNHTEREPEDVPVKMEETSQEVPSNRTEPTQIKQEEPTIKEEAMQQEQPRAAIEHIVKAEFVKGEDVVMSEATDAPKQTSVPPESKTPPSPVTRDADISMDNSMSSLSALSDLPSSPPPPVSHDAPPNPAPKLTLQSPADLEAAKAENSVSIPEENVQIQSEAEHPPQLDQGPRISPKSSLPRSLQMILD